MKTFDNQKVCREVYKMRTVIILFVLTLLSCQKTDENNIELNTKDVQSQTPNAKTYPKLNSQNPLADIDLSTVLSPSDVTYLPTNSNTTSTTEIAVIGDFGNDGAGSVGVAAMINDWAPYAIVTLGDNNYGDEGEMEEFQEFVGGYYCDFIYNPDAPEEFQCNGMAADLEENRFFPALGNHDIDYDPDNYYDYFTLPGNEEYYSQVIGAVEFFILNTSGSYSADLDEPDHEQAIWLEEALSNSDATWKIVCAHHPPYSTGRHSNFTDIQWPFEAWGADAYMSGHNHIYERIHKLSEPNMVYFVNGVGGHGLDECGEKPLDEGEEEDEENFENHCYDEQYGAMLLTVNNTTLTFEFYSMDDGENPIDTYTLTQ